MGAKVSVQGNFTDMSHNRISNDIGTQEWKLDFCDFKNAVSLYSVQIC